MTWWEAAILAAVWASTTLILLAIVLGFICSLERSL